MNPNYDGVLPFLSYGKYEGIVSRKHFGVFGRKAINVT